MLRLLFFLGAFPTDGPTGAAAVRLEDRDGMLSSSQRIAPSAAVEAAMAGPMFSYSWLSAVHQAINTVRHKVMHSTASVFDKPVAFAREQLRGADASATGELSNGSGNVSFVALRAGPFADDSYAASKIDKAGVKALGNETEQEDLEIVNDIQAMEWCMYPTFVLGAALVLTSAYASLASSEAACRAALILAARFVGNLTCSAIVLFLLAWAAQHHREDCERTLALVGMLAFFVEWVFILSGAHEKFFWWTARGRQSGLDVLAEDDKEDSATAETQARRSVYMFRPRSVYLNGLRPLAELYARFTIQSLLMWLYVSGVHKKARELLADAASGRDVVVTRVFVWWILSAGVQLHMTEQMGSGFVDNLNVWARLYRGAREGKLLKHEETEQSMSPVEARRLRLDEVVLRMCMDFVSNLMYYNLMYISVPVLLVATKQPTELVMNAFAVTYILTLDDEKDQRRIKVVQDKDALSAACPALTSKA